jgi:hypothetical protein
LLEAFFVAEIDGRVMGFATVVIQNGPASVAAGGRLSSPLGSIHFELGHFKK